MIPDGVLCGLNFETLIVPAPAPHYWIEDVSIVQAGAMTMLSNSAARRNASLALQDSTLLLIGNPTSASSSLPPLPHAGTEAENVMRQFAATSRTVLLGPSAKPSAYANASPGRFTFIYFVAHGTANRSSPLDSAIVLSEHGRPAYLYARDIVKIPLHARLVTISACDSAGVRTYAGEGLVGLSWAFLRAGAHEVIAALWQADDAATAELMTHVYERIAAGQTPAGALRAAKLAMLRSESVYRKPFYWASFVLYSGL